MHNAGNIFTQLHIKQAQGLAGTAVKGLANAAERLIPAASKGSGTSYLEGAAKLRNARSGAKAVSEVGGGFTTNVGGRQTFSPGLEHLVENNPNLPALFSGNKLVPTGKQIAHAGDSGALLVPYQPNLPLPTRAIKTVEELGSKTVAPAVKVAPGVGKTTLNMGARAGMLERAKAFAKAHPLGTGLGLGIGGMEALNRTYRLPSARRDGGIMGAQQAIDYTANHMANAGFGDRLGFLFNPQGAGDQYRQMAMQQLRNAMA